MKKIILLLTAVILFAGGFLLIREHAFPLVKQEAAINPVPAAAVNPARLVDKGAPNTGRQVETSRPPASQGARIKGSKSYLAAESPRSDDGLRPLTEPPLWETPLDRKTEFTPAELLQLEKERKRQRRLQGYAKSDQPDQYALFHRMIRTREGEAQPAYALDYKLRELTSARQVQASRQARARTQVLSWSERGPANVPGRTRGLLVDPANPQRVWLAGSVAGGIWKTTDAGANWVNKTPDLPNLATTTLALAPANPDIIYAGTGEGFFNVDAVNGDGIFKSLDRGETWNPLSATVGRLEFHNVNRIIVDPQDPNVLLACTNTGFYEEKRTTDNISWILRSTDGGENWSVVQGLPSRIQQLVASPDNFQVQYAAVEAVGVYKSTDGGQTWTLANTGMYPRGRVEIAIAPTNPNRLYASVEGTLSSNSDLYLSDDAGESWTLAWEADNRPNINWLGGQGWYDNTVAVHPYDENTVYLGGIQLWKMTITNREGRSPQRRLYSVEEVNTRSFLDFINLSGEAFGGKLDVGNIPITDFVSVEIRFGPGQSQQAHRFTVDRRGASVPAQDYRYRDYVEVPFEVWDITNNRQLMVSFRDQQENGEFNLLAERSNREHLYIHASTYDSLPHPSITTNGGHLYRNMYFLRPGLKYGATWDPDLLPDAKVVINTRLLEYLPIRLRQTANLTDAYNQYGGKNVYVHPDHHNLVFIKENEGARTFKILNANDGGVYVSRPGTDPGNAQGDWIFAGNGYNTTQFYGVDKKRGFDEYIGGTQDNGTWRSPTLEQASAATSYLPQLGGDGFEASWNYYNPSRLIGTLYNNYIWRSLNGGQTWQVATSGLTDQGTQGPFITQIGTSRSNPDVLYATGASGVWVSADFAASWKLSPIREMWDYNGSFSDVKVSDANSQIVWAGHAISSEGRLHVSTDGGLTFKATSGYEEATLGRISGLATHPTEDSTAYALFSISATPKILRTTDLGQTWTDISGFGQGTSSSTGFPDVAVYSLLVMPHDPSILWVGTEIGLVVSADGGATWSLAQNGLPNVAVWELKAVDDQVVVATHGRGIWSVTIPELYQPVVFVPFINNLGVSPNQKIIVNASLRSLYDSTLVYLNDSLIARIRKTAVKDTVLQLSPGEEGLVTIQLKSYLAGEEYVSHAKTLDFILVNPVLAYGNNFDEPSNDFLGAGFTIGLVPGFTDGAIHSPHPYSVATDYTYQLKVPIIIAESNALFRYQDVAIVEPGDPGAVFGDPNFWDYVIVEGSKDGVEWRRLADGYNADFHAPWRDAFDQGRPGNESMFAEHAYDLHQAFAPGDTVFLRFRLHSDPFVVGWGWAIDDLSIQEEVLAVDSLTLVSAGSGADLGTLADQDTLNLNSTGRKLNIRANTSPETVGSVVFQLNGTVFGTDNAPPYELTGDPNGWTPQEGTYSLTATPYSEADGKGRPGKPLALTFTVLKANEVSSFVLVNAETGADIRTLRPGEVIDLRQVGRKLNIRANTLPLLVGSVVFTYDGHSRTESFFPYALGGFNFLRLKYNSWTPTVGNHTLKATPYSKLNGQGKAGIAHQLQFSVVDGPATAEADNLPAGEVVAYPNPTLGRISLDLAARENLEVTIEVFNLKGTQVHQQQAVLQAGTSKVDIDLSAFPDGMYLIKTVSARQKFASFNILKGR